MKSKSAPSGIVLYAKSSGLTSFSSLWSIKHALGTEKVGHTGTLDSFADGLLVVLSGNLTHLVPHVTGFTKTYEAIVCFGKETDTLDPTGEFIKTSSAPSRQQIESVLPKFTGAVLQTPPAFSALHVDGKRASDLVREGKEVNLEARQIFIYALELCDFYDACVVDGCTYARLKVTCSKGTYIRALARDIAEACGSCAHLCALRRTQVGPFCLEDAACSNMLEPFTIENGIESEKKIRLEKENKNFIEKAGEKLFDRKKKEHQPKRKDSDETIAQIKSRFLSFTPDVAATCGFESYSIKPESEKHYVNGRPLSLRMFEKIAGSEVNRDFFVGEEFSACYSDGTFAGIVKRHDDRLNYGFVVPHGKKSLQKFTWKELMDGAFPLQWKKKGSALTVGSFEAVHAGHRKLIESVRAETEYVHGIVTFSSSIKKESEGTIYTLNQRLEYFENLGLDFAVVIDFDENFSRMSGIEFIEVLQEKCGMKVLVEGSDFNCGYKGSTTMNELSALAEKNGFILKKEDYIEFDGVKVSSRKIKKEISDGNFPDANRMLSQPFTYSIAGFRWTERNAVAEGSVFEAEVQQDQILPKNGSYNVAVRLNDGSSIHTELSIENGRLFLKLPTVRYARSATEIIF